MSRTWIPIVAGLMLTAAVVAPVNAAPTSTEHIVLQRGGIAWDASGTFADSGTWSAPFRIQGGLPSPTVYQAEVKTVESGAHGSFNMAFQGHINIVTGVAYSGTWVITGGTGAYSALRGNGTWYSTVGAFICDGLVDYGG